MSTLPVHQLFWAASLLAASGIGLAPVVARAQTPYNTTPVGYMTLNCLGSSDSIMSLPMSQPPVYTGNATLATTGGVTTLSVSGTPFAVSQFKYVAGSQSNTYYVLLTSGAKTGCFYTITDNGTSSATLNLNGDDVSGITGTITAQVVPYWTLNTVFPNGTGITPTTGFSDATDILVPDTTSSGIDLAATALYYFTSSDGAWHNTSSGAVANDTVLYPDRYFIVRNNTATATSFTVAGAVVTSTLAIPIATSASGQQDNAVAITRPTAVTLDNSGLISSGAFGATVGFSTGDELLAFDNTFAAFNKAATTIYTYVSGSWQRSDGASNVGSDAVFAPGAGVIIRKAPTSSGATLFWSNPSGYSN